MDGARLSSKVRWEELIGPLVAVMIVGFSGRG